MSDLTRYRRVEHPNIGSGGVAHGTEYVPDTTLQQIADAASTAFLWCSTHWRVPEDGTDLCGDEWREIGECEFGQMVIVPAALVEVNEE